MKKLLLLSSLLLCGLFAQAQLADGSTAPNFIAKDINGRTWNLYDILESGRPVLMDVSATWCPPCWGYHNSGALETYFALHGPEGDGTSFVFFIEGDGTTNTNCLYGPTGCNSSTQGNWVVNTPYPILDNSTIGDQYDIAYFPTIFLITPDKKVSEIGTLSATNLWFAAEPSVQPIPEKWGKAVDFQTNARTKQLCGNQVAKPTFTLTNFGTEHITKAIAELRWNGTVIQTKEIETDLVALDQEVIEFEEVNITEAGTLTVAVTSINDADNGKVEEASVAINAAAESYSGNQIEMRLRTDNFGKDIYWAVLDENGTKIDEGGNVQVGLQGAGAFPNGAPADPTAYANGVTITKTITVPNSCFSFILVDAVGNGMQLPGNVKLKTVGETTNFFVAIGTDYAAYSGNAFAQKTTSTQELSPVGELAIAPNPAQDYLKVQFELAQQANVGIWVSNSIGQVVVRNEVSQLATGAHQQNVALNTLQNGLYFLHIKSDKGIATVKPFVVTK